MANAVPITASFNFILIIYNVHSHYERVLIRLCVVQLLSRARALYDQIMGDHKSFEYFDARFHKRHQNLLKV